MRLTSLRALGAFSLLAGLAACEAPVSPDFVGRVAPVVEAKVCADPADPICQSFSSSVYQYDSSLGTLPPGISDWRLVITQFGGQLDFLGAVSHGGAPIADVQNMYVRFFIDNGDNALGAGDLQVVVRNTAAGASLHCGIVTTLPVGAELPSATPAICETGGASYNEAGRFVFEDFRTADLSAPLWESQGFARLQADQRRALFLVEVGNVVVNAGQPSLGAPTAPATRVDTLAVPAGNNGDDEDDEGEDPVDSEAPVITFTGNAGAYSILDQVNISCFATDAGSGLSASNCPSVSAAAYTLALGSTTLNATAQDAAGNIATASTSFTVSVSSTDLCSLARQFASSVGQGNALCSMLRSGSQSFANHVRAQTNKSLSADEAAVLLRLAAGL
jgi:hypothetical protein